MSEMTLREMQAAVKAKQDELVLSIRKGVCTLDLMGTGKIPVQSEAKIAAYVDAIVFRVYNLSGISLGWEFTQKEYAAKKFLGLWKSWRRSILPILDQFSPYDKDVVFGIRAAIIKANS